jgi:uncharacterized protein with NRDE domain
LCLVALAWRARADLPLVVAANRDEWRDRPTEAAHWWPDRPAVYAGRDGQAGGTWMGVTRGGRFAAITNFRDPSDRRTDVRSRGEIVGDFLAGNASPEAFIRELAPRAGLYNGFNLVAGDLDSLWYFGSREGTARAIAPGVHALSNHLLDEPWPKVVRARMAMEAAIAEDDPMPRLFAAMRDLEGAPDTELPKTGVSLDWERRLAPSMIVGADYGTRSTTVVCRAADGTLRMEEHTLDEAGHATQTRAERFTVGVTPGAAR